VRIKFVLGAGLVAVAAVVAVLLLGEGQRRAGSNYVPEHGPVTELRAGDTHCETGVIVPGDAAALRLAIGTYGNPTPELRVRATAPGEGTVTSGRLPAGRREGRVVIPMSKVADTVTGAEVCVRAGSGRNVLYGRGDSIRLSWLREGSESRLSMLAVVAHRLGLAKLNPLGSWLMVLLVGMLGAAWFIALRLVLREAGP
jgi:hypothetical protein